MKRIYTLTLFLVFTLCLSAQDTKPRIAVLDCTKSSSINEDTKDAVREIISATLVNTGLYEIVERSLLEQVLKEQGIQVSGMIDNSQITEIGKIAGANKIVLSIITIPQGDMFILSIKMLDVKTGSIDKQVVNGVPNNLSEMFNKIEAMTLKLINADIETKIREKAIIDSINNAKIQAEKEKEAKLRAEAEARSKAEDEAKAKAEAEKIKKEAISQLLVDMVYVAGGTFTMGATPEQRKYAERDEKPTHRVTLSDYYIGKYEVTQAQWKAVMGSNPSRFQKGDNYPVENVSWNDICGTDGFLEKLNAALAAELGGKHFALPTEAQWEYAARGGGKSKGYKYSGSNDAGTVAYYDGNSGSQTHPVGLKAPNELGLYDMSGNVWEWCSDWYRYGGYGLGSQTNPQGPSSGSHRVLRGGSWYYYASYCRVSLRSNLPPAPRYLDNGFRVALVL